MESIHEPVSLPTPQGSTRPAIKISWPHLVLGLIGIGISFYTVILHNQIKAGGGCGAGDCEAVIGSKYGALFGIPVGVFGMLFYAVIILLSIVTKESTATARQIAAQRLIVSSFGLASALAFFYISHMVIRAFCPYCMATHTTTLLVFIVSLAGYLKARRGDQSSSSSTL
jgi:uncharacterized membrane protein